MSRAMKLGAQAYVLKTQLDKEPMGTIRASEAGNRGFPPTFLPSTRPEPAADPFPLTEAGVAIARTPGTARDHNVGTSPEHPYFNSGTTN